jgi:nitrite transporter NirC
VPLPIPDALDANEAAAVTKAAQARSDLPRYLILSAFAGAFVGFAIVLLLMVSAPLIATQHPFAKLVQGSVFGLALTLVVFAGAELFTGNNMVMIQGLWARKVKTVDLALVWAASLVGNLVGSLGFAWMVKASGIVTSGAPAGQQTVYKAALAGIAATKHNLSGGQLFFRAVLCNMLVCLALWMAARATSDAAKLVVLWFALLAFIGSGFEHSIANMTSLGLAAMIGVGKWSDLWRNLLYTIPGNIVGGGVVIGFLYGYLGKKAPAKQPSLATTVVEIEDLVPAKPLAPPRRTRTTTPPPRTTRTATRSGAR